MRFAWGAFVILGLLLSSSASAQTARCPAGPPGWKADSRTGCKIWNQCPQHNETVTWSGACIDGMANGVGTSVWYRDGKQIRFYEGSVKAGLSDGRGIARAEWGSIEGEWREGRLDGQVVVVSEKGRYEGAFSRDRPHGYGVLTTANGKVYKGNWTNGCLKINARGEMIAMVSTAAECGVARR